MIGVVGPSEEATRLAEAVEDVAVRRGDAEAVLAAGPDVVVAVGEAAVAALVRADVGVPILPVASDGGLPAVSSDRAPAVISEGLERGFDVREWPLLEVVVEDEVVARGVFDVMLVTREPARISEYSVETPGAADRFRADGVVVATPAGSHGYAHAVGGPLLDADATCLAVVPVAAFDVRSTVRVADADAVVSIRVERDEGDISLFVDGEPHGRVPPKRPATVRVADRVETVRSPEE